MRALAVLCGGNRLPELPECSDLFRAGLTIIERGFWHYLAHGKKETPQPILDVFQNVFP